MSKNKGFSETSAGRYSLALYELATEAKEMQLLLDKTNKLLQVNPSVDETPTEAGNWQGDYDKLLLLINYYV